MLCTVCNERIATIHLTCVLGDTVSKKDLCEICGKEVMDLPQNGLESQLQPPPFDETLDRIVDRDPRYPKKAYLFVVGAFVEAYEKRMIDPRAKPLFSEPSAIELLEMFREHALTNFGTNAKAILNAWGIRSCEDFGEIIFNLIDSKLFTIRPEDTKHDFHQGYNFDQAFPPD
jgi:uncharacterized repeat protein (TIGR04138 family)